MPNDPVQAIEFAQSKGQARRDGRTGITFADVAGCDEAVRELKFVVEVRACAPIAGSLNFTCASKACNFCAGPTTHRYHTVGSRHCSHGKV